MPDHTHVKSLHQFVALTLSWRRPLPYRNQSINLLRKSMDWFLHDNGLRHERVNGHAICTCMQKINFIPLVVFEITKFKNRTIWLANSIFAFNSRTRFFLDIRFYQNHKSHYGAWFKPKKSTYQWTIFLCKSKKLYFWGCFEALSQKIFPKNSTPSVSLPLRHPNFMRSFRQFLRRFGENVFTYWRTDILAVVKS